MEFGEGEGELGIAPPPPPQHHWGSVYRVFRVFNDGLKMTTSGPNPCFWAQNHGFGPDVVILGVLGGNPRKYAACVARPWAQPLKLSHHSEEAIVCTN